MAEILLKASHFTKTFNKKYRSSRLDVKFILPLNALLWDTEEVKEGVKYIPMVMHSSETIYYLYFYTYFKSHS